MSGSTRESKTLFNIESKTYYCCCKATRLCSRLIQVAYMTSVSCLCRKPASFEILGCKYVRTYITAYASISIMTFESEALSFGVNRFRKKTKGHSEHSQIKHNMENFKPGRNPVSYRKPRFC